MCYVHSNCKRVGKSFGADAIFDDISSWIPHGDGSRWWGRRRGQDPLLRFLIRAEGRAGAVFMMKVCGIGNLEQRPELVGDRSLWDEMLTAFTALHAKKRNLPSLPTNGGYPTRDANES